MNLLFSLFLLVLQNPFESGLKAYQEGRYKEAFQSFAEAEKAAGDRASAELLFNEALSALQAGELAELESSAEKAAARGGTTFAPLRDFLLGNSAFAKVKKAEDIAKSPEAEPSAFTEAITHAETAKNFWQQAAASRPDWPEARRNIERAALKIEQLKKEKEEADKKKQKEKDEDKDKDKDQDKNQDENKEDKDKKDKEKKEQEQNKPKEEKPPEEKKEEKKEPEPKPQDSKDQKKDEKKTPLQQQKVELSPEQLRMLFDKLDDKERQKIALRKSRQQAKKTPVEKDW